MRKSFMKKFTRGFCGLIFLLCFAVFAHAQSIWTGTYEFSEDGGKTAGGSVIFIKHKIDITEENGKRDAHITSNGFQTSRDVYADAKISGDKLLLYFREAGEDNFTSKYEKGDLLLTLERKEIEGKTKILTEWNAFGPMIEKNEKSGEVYFEKAETKEKSAADVKWKRVETENKEISLLMPENSNFFFDKEGYSVTKSPRSFKEIHFKNLRLMIGYKDGVTVWFETYDVKNGKEDFPYYLRSYNSDRGNIKDYEFGTSILRQIISETENSYSVVNYFYSDNRIYQIGVGSRNKNNKTLTDFLTAIEFQGKNLFLADTKKMIEPKETAVLENLVTTPLEIIVEDLKKTEIEGTVKNQISGKISNDDSDEKGLFILSKPRPRYTEQARMQNQQGEVTLRVTFGSNGQIQKIDVVKGLGNGLTESAVKAARQIRFLPAEKNGEPFTVTKTVQFSFSIY